MADRGTIFSAPMVRALLDGRKTQTRRLLSKAGLLFDGGRWPKGLDLADMKLASAWVDAGPSPAGNPGPYLKADWPYGRLIEGDESDGAEWLMARLYPKVQPGDRLYVREAWSHTGQGVWTISAARMSGRGGVIYGADGNDVGAKYWPSIHMPREFSRLTLMVTDVRVQRLQDISEADAISEGLIPHREEELPGHEVETWHWLPGIDRPETYTSGVGAYRALWNSLHAKPGERWDDNPWVCATSFEVKRGNIDAATA